MSYRQSTTRDAAASKDCQPSHSLAFIPCDFLAVWSRNGSTVGSFLDLAGEGVGHPGALVVLRLVVPDLLLVAAVNLRHDELHVFGDELTLLPGDRLALLCTSPDLEEQNV